LNNPVKTAIPVFLWTDAVLRGREMTALRDGIKGASALKAPIKFIWNFAGNALVNQHADIRRTRQILTDESLCEMIVVIEQVMTSSAAFADILLPAVSSLEENDFALESGSSSDMAYVIFCQQAINPVGECRSVYDMCAGIAARLGIEKRFTEGKTRDQWLAYLLSESRQQLPDLPTSLKEAWQEGIYLKTVDSGPRIALKRFREDPDTHPLPTPSGKIEIFSDRLWRIGRQWELPEDDQIPALPIFLPEREGHLDLNKEQFPLQMITHHCKQRTHSTYGNVDWLKRVAPQQLWINPFDAGLRGIEHGDTVLVYNNRGRCIVSAKVTPRIMPGVVTLPQGAWFRADTDGIDRGACANTLTSLHPSPLAKGNPHHSNLVEVKRYESQTA
jgi:anaerobic dimethyl sulfoxide reductase subunit A